MDKLPMTPQEVFNAAWAHFLKEDSRPASELLDPDRPDFGYVCSYLTEDGRKCAIGLCIPDGHYAQSNRAPLKGFLDHFNFQQWRPFQRALHDSMVDLKSGEWSLDYDSADKRETHYRKVAQEYSLNIPE